MLFVVVEKMQPFVASPVAKLAHLGWPCLSPGSKFHVGFTKDVGIREVQEGNRIGAGPLAVRDGM